ELLPAQGDDAGAGERRRQPERIVRPAEHVDTLQGQALRRVHLARPQQLDGQEVQGGAESGELRGPPPAWDAGLEALASGRVVAGAPGEQGVAEEGPRLPPRRLRPGGGGQEAGQDATSLAPAPAVEPVPDERAGDALRRGQVVEAPRVLDRGQEVAVV